MGTLVDVKQIKGLPERLQGCVHIYRDVTGTAVKTSSPRFSARWDVTDPEVTEYIDGMMVQILVPVAGHASYGTVLQINSLGYKPVVWDVNTGISKRYPVGSVVIATYNATQTAKAYLGSGQQNVDVVGCWQICDYDYNSNTTTIKDTYIGEVFTPAGTFGIQAKSIILEDATGRLQSLTTTGGTATSKEPNPSGFLPGKMFYTALSSGEITEGNLPASSINLYDSYDIDFRYSSNCGSNLVTGKMLYLVGTIGGDGLFYLADTWWSQDLPTQADGKIYVFVGNVISTTVVHMSRFHPAYYYNGDHICLYGGRKNEVEVSTTEPTDEDVEIWINPEGEADDPQGTGIVRNGIIAHKAIPAFTARPGERYYFADGRVKIKTMETLTTEQENLVHKISVSAWTDSGETIQKIYEIVVSEAEGVLVKIPDGFAARNFLTDPAYRTAICKSGNITSRDTASQSLTIADGKIFCIKETKVETGMGKNIANQIRDKKYKVRSRRRARERKRIDGVIVRGTGRNHGYKLGEWHKRPMKYRTSILEIAATYRGIPSVRTVKIYSKGRTSMEI